MAVLMIRAGIVVMYVMRSMARCVIVRGRAAGIVVAQRHAQARRRGRGSLDRDGKRQRERNEDAGESWRHR
jgi:hypothetical protein